jgi:glycosyltransferase involved in cell wall biosynthesis
MNQPSPTISVIIPAYERADILIMCLQSLEMQTVRDFEVLVIDDGSEEPLEPIVAGKNLSIKPRWQRLETKNTRASAKNAGIEQAQGKIALFWDADMVADSRMIEYHMKNHLTRSETLVVVGYRFHLAISALPFDQLSHLVTRKSVSFDLSEIQCDHRERYFRSLDWELARSEAPWREAIGCHISAPLSLLREHGGFDSSFDGAYGYEDHDLAYRLYCQNITFLLEARAVGYHCDHAPLSGQSHDKEKRRNKALFREKHPHAFWLPH